MTRVALGALVAGLAAIAAGCGGADRSACAPIESGGVAKPEALVVTDLALHGPARSQSLQVNDAVRAELKARSFKAGAHTIGLLACDNSTSAAGASDPGRCNANANEYVGDETVLAVLGSPDARCLTAQIPPLNQAPDGAIPLVSPSNMYACLTRGGPGCDLTEPGKYYPSGARTFFRLSGDDVTQAAADAQIARDRGMRRVYVLDDNEAYGVGLAMAFRSAAQKLGLEVVGSGSWRSGAKSYKPLFDRVRSSGADSIFVAGSIDRGGVRLLRAKVAALGPNDGPVRMLATDLFAEGDGLARAGAAARGLLVSMPGEPLSSYPPAARAYARKLRATLPAGQAVDPVALHGAEAARIVLRAIAASDGSRADVVARLSKTHVDDGLIGSFSFDTNGDPVDASGPIAGFTVLRMAQKLEPAGIVEPAPATIRAAAAGT